MDGLRLAVTGHDKQVYHRARAGKNCVARRPPSPPIRPKDRFEHCVQLPINVPNNEHEEADNYYRETVSDRARARFAGGKMCY